LLHHPILLHFHYFVPANWGIVFEMTYAHFKTVCDSRLLM
jgi:hypothetical protein